MLSTISQIVSLKINLTHKQLLKMAEAVGGELLITPMKDMTVQVPYDLQKIMRKSTAREAQNSISIVKNADCQG